MPFTHTLRGERFTFPDLRALLARANEPKSGDDLAGIAARSDRERAAAKLAPADDLTGILVAAIDGLTFGCGDAVIGVNPATDSVETVAAILGTLDRLIGTLGLPTQACCLAHVTTQLAALDRRAPVDLLFQSV